MNTNLQKWKLEHEDKYEILNYDFSLIPYYNGIKLNLLFMTEVTELKFISKSNFVDRFPSTLEFIKYNNKMQYNYERIHIDWIKHYCNSISNIHKMKVNKYKWEVIQPFILYQKKIDKEYSYHFLISINGDIFSAYFNTLLVCTNLWPIFLKYNPTFAI